MVGGHDDYQAARRSQSHVAEEAHGIGLGYGLGLWEASIVCCLSLVLDLHGHRDHRDHHLFLHVRGLTHGLFARGVSHRPALVRGFGLVPFGVEVLH